MTLQLIVCGLYRAENGLLFDIIETDGADFWGKCLNDDSLYVRFDEQGNAQAVRRLSPEADKQRREKRRLLSELAGGTAPAPANYRLTVCLRFRP